MGAIIKLVLFLNKSLIKTLNPNEKLTTIIASKLFQSFLSQKFINETSCPRFLKPSAHILH